MDLYDSYDDLRRFLKAEREHQIDRLFDLIPRCVSFNAECSYFHEFTIGASYIQSNREIHFSRVNEWEGTLALSLRFKLDSTSTKAFFRIEKFSMAKRFDYFLC